MCACVDTEEKKRGPSIDSTLTIVRSFVRRLFVQLDRMTYLLCFFFFFK